MKNLMIAAMAAMLAFVMGCQKKQITAWGLTAPESDLTARIGVQKDNTEVGIVGKYLVSDDIEWGPEPDFIGPYLIFHLTQDVSIEDTPDASPFKAFLESLHAQPYAGLEIIAPYGGSQRKFQPNFIAGTRFTIDPLSNFSLIVEWDDGDQGPNGMFVGISGQF